MCIVMVKPKGEDLDKEDLREAWINNDDGGGFMYAADGGIKICKGYMKFPAFWKAWQRHALKDKAAIVHFRIATGGEINQANCHPFAIDRGTAVAHNGIFKEADIPIVDSAFSDTVHFVRHLKRLNDPNFLKDPKVREWIESVCKHYPSKLVFLGADGEFEIVGEKLGSWYEGCWYSNDSFLYPTLYSRKVYDYSGDRWSDVPDDDADRCDLCGSLLIYSVEQHYSMCQGCAQTAYKDISAEIECAASLEADNASQALVAGDGNAQDWKNYLDAQKDAVVIRAGSGI